MKPVCSDFIANRSLGLGISAAAASESTSTSNGPQPVSTMGKLCQVNHGNLEACRDATRQFLPSIREFFDEAIEQIDPVNEVEPQYWLIAQSDWAWKALRLLAKRSPHYFMQMNQNAKPIKEYLEGICTKLDKEYKAEQQKQQAALAKQQQKEAKQLEVSKLQQQHQLKDQQQQAQEVIELEKDESPDSVRQIDDEESNDATIEEDLSQNQNSQDNH